MHPVQEKTSAGEREEPFEAAASTTEGLDSIESEQARECFVRILRDGSIVPHFQPIVDLYSGEVFGYEILSRGVAPLEMPGPMFRCAQAWGLQWELELACRRAAFRKMASLAPDCQKKFFFLNVSPQIFHDRRFLNGFCAAEVPEFALSHGRVIIEITEATTVTDYPAFEELIRYYVGQGFRVALDDFGAGHSGLITLVAMAPHFLKLDRALISSLHDHSYKQKLVKAIVSFSAASESSLIAEGIESEEELQTLFRLGVRYAQGFHLGRPSPEPREIAPQVGESIVRLIRRYNCGRGHVESRTGHHAVRPVTTPAGSTTCEELDDTFRKQANLDHVVVLNAEAPIGLILRRGFHKELGSRFGYSLYQRRDLSEIMKSSPLCVGEGVELAVLGSLAMGREPDDLYDPVVVVDPAGRLLGTITMKQLIFAVIDMEVKAARSVNPLTSLPGNIIIQGWLEEALHGPHFTLVYADLDNFEGYNDSYGFTQGDLMIRLAANVLSNHLLAFAPGAKLGHVGGDDFIVVSTAGANEAALKAICSEFDAQKRNLFSACDVQRGFFTTVNRRGQEEQLPLVTLSLAVLGEGNLSPVRHPGEIGKLAAALKRKVKESNALSGSSGYLIDRRQHEGLTGAATQS